MFLKIRNSKMEIKNRLQLTLFVREIENFEIEKIRKKHNIEQ